MIPKVKNMISPNGREIPNQFIITTDNSEIFQSYDSTIAIKFPTPATFTESGHYSTLLDINKWDYSKTTSKYRNIFLDESTKETQAKIDRGEYQLTDLNKGA